MLQKQAEKNGSITIWSPGKLLTKVIGMQCNKLQFKLIFSFVGGREGAEKWKHGTDKLNYCLNKGEDFVLKSILNEVKSAKF